MEESDLEFDGTVVFAQMEQQNPLPGTLRLKLCEKQRSISAVLSACNPPLCLPFSLDEGEPITFDDTASSCSLLHGQFRFQDSWEYNSFLRFYKRVRAAFELRLLHQTLVEDVGMPVDQLPDFVPAKRAYTAGSSSGGRSLPFLAGLEDGLDSEGGGWGGGLGEGGVAGTAHAGSEETLAIIMAAAERARREEATRRRPGVPMLLSDGMQLPASHAQGGSGEGHPPPCPTTAHATYTLPARVADKYVHPGRPCGAALHMAGPVDAPSYASVQVYSMYLRCLGLLPDDSSGGGAAGGDARGGGAGGGGGSPPAISLQDVFATCNRVPQDLVAETSGLLIQPAPSDRGGASGRLLAAGAGAAILPFAGLAAGTAHARGSVSMWVRATEQEDSSKRCCALCSYSGSRAAPSHNTPSTTPALGLHPFVPVNGSGEAVWACTDCMARVLDRRLRCVEKGKIIDTDASELTCALCGLAMGIDGGITEGETLVVCSAIRCPRSYCPTCIGLLLNKKQRASMEADDEWLCPPCAAHSTTVCGVADGAAYSTYRRLPTPEEAMSTPLTLFVPASARAALGLDEEEDEEQGGVPGRRGRGGWNRGMRGGPRVAAMNSVWKAVDPYREHTAGGEGGGGGGGEESSPWTPAPTLPSGTPVGTAAGAGSKRDRSSRGGGWEGEGAEEVLLEEESGAGGMHSSSGARTKRSKQHGTERAGAAKASGGSLFTNPPSTLPPAGQPDLHSLYTPLFGQTYTGLVDFHLHALLYANHVKEVRRRTDPRVDPVTVLETENECCLCKDGGNVLECDWTTHEYYHRLLKGAARGAAGLGSLASANAARAKKAGRPSSSSIAAEKVSLSPLQEGAAGATGAQGQDEGRPAKVPYGGMSRTWAATQARMLAKRQREALAAAAAAAAWLGRTTSPPPSSTLRKTAPDAPPPAAADVLHTAGDNVAEQSVVPTVALSEEHAAEASPKRGPASEAQAVHHEAQGDSGAAVAEAYGKQEMPTEHGSGGRKEGGDEHVDERAQAIDEHSGRVGAPVGQPDLVHTSAPATTTTTVLMKEQGDGVALEDDGAWVGEDENGAVLHAKGDSAPSEGAESGSGACPEPAPKRRGRPPRSKGEAEQALVPASSAGAVSSAAAPAPLSSLYQHLPSVRCPKVYHQECLGFSVGHSGQWHCPRHTCRDCSALASAFCKYCPNSYCSTHAARVLGRDMHALSSHQAQQARLAGALLGQRAPTEAAQTSSAGAPAEQAHSQTPSTTQQEAVAAEADAEPHVVADAPLTQPGGEGEGGGASRDEPSVHPPPSAPDSVGAGSSLGEEAAPARSHPWHPMDLREVFSCQDEQPRALSMASRTVVPVLGLALTGPWAEAAALPEWPGRRAPDADIPQGCSQLLCPTCAVWVASCVEKGVLEPEPCSGRPLFPVTHVRTHHVGSAAVGADDSHDGSSVPSIPHPSPEDAGAIVQAMASRMGPFAQFVRWQQAKRAKLMDYAAAAAAHALSALPANLLTSIDVSAPADQAPCPTRTPHEEDIASGGDAGASGSGAPDVMEVIAQPASSQAPISARDIPLSPPPLDLSTGAWAEYCEARGKEKRAGGEKAAARKRAHAAAGAIAGLPALMSAQAPVSRARTSDGLVPCLSPAHAARKQYKRRPAVDWRTLSEQHVQMLLAGLDHETGLRRVGRPPNWLKELFASRGVVLHAASGGGGEEQDEDQHAHLPPAASAEDDEMDGKGV